MFITHTSSLREHKSFPTSHDEMATGQNELLFAQHSMIVSMQVVIAMVSLQSMMRWMTQNRVIVVNFVYVETYLPILGGSPMYYWLFVVEKL